MPGDNSLVMLMGERKGMDLRGLPVILFPDLKARHQLGGNQMYHLHSTPKVFANKGTGPSTLNSTVGQTKKLEW